MNKIPYILEKLSSYKDSIELAKFIWGILLIPIIIFYKNISGYFSKILNKIRQVQVGIAVDHNSNSDFVKNCNKLMCARSFSGKYVKFYDVSQKIPSRNRKDIESYVDSSTYDLIIWTDKINSTTNSFVPLSFTFNKVHPEIRDTIRLELYKLSQAKYFAIFSTELDEELKIEIGNISNYVLYAVTLILLPVRGVSDTILTMENLCKEIKDTKGEIEKLLKSKLVSLYNILALDFALRRKILKSYTLYKKAYKLDATNINTLGGIACEACLLGSKGDEYKDEAKRCVQELLRLYPNSSVARVDAAYFRILERNYDAALNHYNKYNELSPDAATTNSVIDFLTEEIKDSNEPALLFARGYMEYIIQHTKAKGDLEKFLNKSEEIHYKKMIIKTKQLLKEIKKWPNHLG
jgi:tetratricopeptide (TPR) repeat protein